MNKQEFIITTVTAITDMGLEPKDVIVAAGGASLLFGFREETEDVDLDIPNESFVRLLSTGLYELNFFHTSSGDVEVLSVNSQVDVHRRIKEVETVWVDGVQCYSHRELLKMRLHLNRPKDQPDIIRLRAMGY